MSSHGGSNDVDPKIILDAAVSKLLTNLPSHGDGDTLREMLMDGSCERLLEELDSVMGRIGKLKRGKFSRFIERFRPGIQNLNRFSDAIGIYVQSDPTYSALIWGSLKLLVQLSGDYLHFFDTVTESIVKIADALPDYKEYESIFLTQPKIRLALARIYVDILDYCGQLTNMFYKNKRSGSAKARSGAAIFIHSIWEPVTDRLDTIMKRLHEHHTHLKELADLEANKGIIDLADRLERVKIVQNDMATWERQYATETKALLDQIRRQLGSLVSQENKNKRSILIREIRRWLHPPSVTDRLQEIRKNLEKYDASGKWLLSAPEYTGWRDASAVNNRGNLLWINGKPGAGKTHLVPVIHDDLEAQRKQVIVFICDYQEETRNTRRGLLSSVLSQILGKDQSEGLLDIFSLMMAQSESATAVSLEELGDLLTVTLRHISPSDYAIIIDGLDECENSGEAAKDLSTLLADMVSMKAVILGRTADEGLFTALSTHRTLELTPERVRPDIEAYIIKHLDKIMEFNWAAKDRELREPSRLVEYLADRADGMFMWIRIVLELLCTPVFRQRTEFLLTLGDSGVEGHLDHLYHRIIALVCKKPPATQIDVTDTFNIILYAQRKLRVDEFLTILQHQKEPDNNPKCFLDNLIRACGGLVQVTLDGHIQFIHGSVKDYFIRHDGKIGLKVPDERMDIRFTDICLHYLLWSIPHEPLSRELGKRADRNVAAERYPLLAYSSRYWTVHCTSLSKHTRRRAGTPFASKDARHNAGQTGHSVSMIIGHLNSFIPKKAAVLTWLEAWFLFGGSRNVDDMLLLEVSETFHQLCEREHNFASTAHQRDILCARLRIIQQEIIGFMKLYRDLPRNPAQLWICDASFLEPSVSQLQSMLLQPNPPEDPLISDTPFFSFSMKSNDGNKAAACFIWPSRVFSERVSDEDPEAVKLFDAETGLLEEASKGWKITVKTGQYDQENFTVTPGMIDIDHNVIHEYLSLGLWKLDQMDSGEALPDDYAAILPPPLVLFSDDLHTLIVLRDVYNLNELKGKLTGRSPRLIMSCRIKLDYSMQSLLADHYVAEISSNGSALGVYKESAKDGSELTVFSISKSQQQALSRLLWITSSKSTGSVTHQFRSLAMHPVRTVITWISVEGGVRIADFIRNTEEEIASPADILPYISSRRNLKYRPCGNILYIEDSDFEFDLRANQVFQHAVNEPPKHPKVQPSRHKNAKLQKNPFGPPPRTNSWNRAQSPLRVQEGFRSPVRQSYQQDHNTQPFYQQMDITGWNNNWDHFPEFTFRPTHQLHHHQYPHQYANYAQNPYFPQMFFPQVTIPPQEPPAYEETVSVSCTTPRKRRSSQGHHHNSAWLSPPQAGMMSPNLSFGESEISSGEFSANTSFEDDIGMIPRGPEIKRSRSANSRRELHA